MPLTKVTGGEIDGDSSINVTGIVTATKFSGNVTGDVNSTGVSTFTTLKVGTGVTISGGIVTATTFSGALTGNATGLSGTPNITVGNIIASNATISGNVSVAGTLTYEDVTNVDSIGLVTARTGVRIDAGGLVVVGVTTVATGSTAAPSITPTGDSDTGIFFPSADTIAFGEGGSEAARIDSSGRLLLGTSSVRGTGTNASTATVQIETANNTAALQVIANPTSAFGPTLFFGKSRGNALNSTAIVENNDILGGIIFSGADGTDLNTIGAVIETRVDGTPGTNTMPGRLVFLTTSTTAGAPAQERMRIGSSGNVGIGITNPNTKLDIVCGVGSTGIVVRPSSLTSDANGNASAVNNMIHLRMPYGANAGAVANAGAKIGIVMEGRNDEIFQTFGGGKRASIYGVSEDDGAGYSRRMGLAFYTSPTDAAEVERIRISNTGNVGIGTNNPSSKLSVFDNFSATSGVTIEKSFVGGGDGNSVARIYGIDSGVSETGIRIGVKGTGGLNATDAYILQGLNNGTTRFVFTSSGNVGIGTNNPLVATHIAIPTNGTALKLNNTIGGSGSYVDLDFDTYTTSQAGYANAPATIRVIDDGSFSGHISFRTKGPLVGSSQTEKVRITAGGNVGIGTTNPGAKLHVSGGNIKVDSGYGIDFSATANSSGTMTSELLSDYEEGTWTPVFQGSTSNPTITYVQQNGWYTRIGNIVYINLILTTNAKSGGSGDLRIGGIPFTPSTEGYYQMHGLNISEALSMSTAITSAIISEESSATQIFTDVNTAALGTGLNNNRIRINGWYKIS